MRPGYLCFLSRPFGLPSVGNPPDQDRPERASCPVGARFSSLKIALGGTPFSASKCTNNRAAPPASCPGGDGRSGYCRWALAFVQGNQAGSPIKAAQHRMCCKVGPSVPVNCEGSSGGAIEPKKASYTPPAARVHWYVNPIALLGGSALQNRPERPDEVIDVAVIERGNIYPRRIDRVNRELLAQAGHLVH